MRVNFTSVVRQGSRIVSKRRGHNVLTDDGKAWLASLCAQTVGTTDAPFTQARPRWMGFGSVQTPEVPTITALSSPVLLAGGTDYLRVVSAPTKIGVQAFRYTEVFGLGAFDADPVDVASAGLFVDVDAALDPTVSTHSPIFYKSFPAQSVAATQTLTIEWELYV